MRPVIPHANARRPSRRDLLRAAGGAAAIFPWLGGRAQAALPPTPRLVLLMQTNGTNQANFWPSLSPALPGTPDQPPPPPPAPPGPGAHLDSRILARLGKDPALAPVTTLIKGLYNRDAGSGNGHDHGFAGLYSGYRTVGTFSNPKGSGVSIDRVLRQSLTFTEPFPTLNCGVLASDTPIFKTHRRSFSYADADHQTPTEIDPYRLYARFFAVSPRALPGTDPVAVAKERLARRRSVLDVVKADLDGLRPRLPAFDRRTLDAHASAVRAFEQNLAATLTPQTPRAPACTALVGPPEAQGIDLRHEDNVPTLVKLMFDFVAVALACQLTRIVTFQFGCGGEKWYFRWLGINENSHDDIFHHDHGNDPLITEKVVKINQWYTEQVAYLATRMAAVPEEGGSLLDNSLVVWGNELATGPHGLENIPIALLGKAAGRLPAAGQLIDKGPQDYHRLGTSLLNVMGVPAAGFGQQPACGPIAGLGI